MICIDCKERPRINRAYCRECKNRRWREWYVQNKAKRYEHNKRWRVANPDKAKAQSDRQQESFSPEQKRERYEKSLEAHLRSNERRRARKLSAFIEEVHPLVVLERDDGVCGICDEDVDPMNFHVDHIEPLSKGGEHSYANTQVAHPVCNLRKAARCES